MILSVVIKQFDNYWNFIQMQSEK